MSNVQSLIAEFTNLSSESKKRFADVRHASDTSIKLLKSTTQLSDQNIQLQLTNTLILACETGNLKINSIAIPIIQKLLNNHFIPDEKLNILIKTLTESSHLAVEIQLKILQCLPSFMLVYKSNMSGSTLLGILSICSNLTTSNKSPIVSNAASATLQQLFTNIFDNINDSQTTGDRNVKIDNNQSLKVDTLSYEGYLIFQDLNQILINKKPEYFGNSIHLKSQAALEIIESIVNGHQNLFSNHKELSYLLRSQTVPALLKILNSPTKHYPLILRALRIIQILLTTQLNSLEIEIEIILSYLNHLLLDDADSNGEAFTPDWEKVLILEMYNYLFSNFDSIKSIYEKYDHDKSKKDVLKELFTVLSTFFANDNQYLNDIVRPFSRPSIETNSNGNQGLNSQNFISVENSSLKTMVIDHLDKNDPSNNIPNTYSTYLILEILIKFSGGVSNYVSNLSNNGNEKELEASVDLINAIMGSTASEVTSLYERFIYTSLNDLLFQKVLKSYQSFTHAIGLLGLNSIRNILLLKLSNAITKNVSKQEIKDDSETTSIYEDQKKQLMALGGSIVESISSTIQGNDTNGYSVSFKSRYFNSRHVLCLKTFLNLAVSLGSTLGEAWSIIWITLQWVAYYLNGSDDFSGSKESSATSPSISTFTNYSKPQLTQTDYGIIDLAYKRLFDSINDIPANSFKEVLECLGELSDVAFSSKLENEFKFGLEESPYNKTFYLNMIFQICDLNTEKFLIKDDEVWGSFTEYITKLGSKRDLNFNIRVYIVESFTKIITSMAFKGFNNDELVSQTADKTLDGLNLYLEKLFKQGIPKELLVLNCETEIHLTILTTLYFLIEKYDLHYQNSWGKVFQILNTPFEVTGTDETNLKEKFQSMVEKSFETMKLILDEFLLSLPFQQLKKLIDTLINFANQSFDLNISFSAVSYFWLISDSLKSRLSQFENNNNTNELVSNINSEKQLINYIDTTNESYNAYICLDLYLLFGLAKISKQETERAQVREGAIQTFFQIIDVHGIIMEENWDMIYSIAFPCLFEIIPPKNNKEWNETIRLLLEGFVTMYRKFFLISNSKIINLIDKWQMLLNYMNKLLDLQEIEISIFVFKSFQNLIESPFEINNDEIREMLFNLWSNYSIEYNLIDINYQETLVQYMICFTKLYRIIEKNLTLNHVDKIVDVFNKSARYPILSKQQTDENKPSKLQSTILSNIKVINKDDIQVQAVIIQLLSQMIIYPYAVRPRIEQKLSSKLLSKKNYKIPTFIAISSFAIEIMKEKFEKFGYINLFTNDQDINKCIKSLLELIENRAVGVKQVDKLPLWIQAHNILQRIIEELILQNEISEDLWELILKNLSLAFNMNNENDKWNQLTIDEEQVKIQQYKEISDKVIPKLIEDKNELICDLIKNLYLNSFLYDLNEEEKKIIKFQDENEEQIIESINKLTMYDFDENFTTTEPIKYFKNEKIRFNCLKELFNLLKILNQKHQNDKTINKFKSQIELYIIKRISFTLRRIISDLKILGKKRPIPILQNEEINYILNNLIEIKEIIQNSNVTENKNILEFKKLNKLIIKLIPYNYRFQNNDWIKVLEDNK
ncbi:MON2 [Candida pseudojiufengensis]|uniref:MON2 n=1 Tax=Candida pseudojiufengensis TaxID=497109 RepID=UPI0022243BF2|nr:MON2 [Candida pseudojiufengensis]KAI5966786.1 MON2 [Candida pseudojiufengensis]